MPPARRKKFLDGSRKTCAAAKNRNNGTNGRLASKKNLMKTQDQVKNISTNTVQLISKPGHSWATAKSWPDDLTDCILREAAVKLAFDSTWKSFNTDWTKGRKNMASQLLQKYLKRTPRSYQMAIGKYIRSSIHMLRA
jgi:hypothetical protein